MDEDDMPGYIMDYIHEWADKNGIKKSDKWASQGLGGNQIGDNDAFFGQSAEEFMFDILKTAGYIDG